MSDTTIDDLLAKDRAIKHTNNGDIEMVIMKDGDRLEQVDFDGILFKILIKFAGDIKNETLSLGIDSPSAPVKSVFSDALYRLRGVIKAAEQQATDNAKGCADCKKLRCENCERLWAS